MPKIIVTNAEWKFAHQYLDSAPNGTKLPYSAITVDGAMYPRSTYRDTFSSYQTTHSFIKINGTIYALAQGKSQNAIAGKGAFGLVKFMIDEENNSHVVKIQDSFEKLEIKILDSLNHYSNGTNKRVDKEKYYTHMYNKGDKNLSKIIPLLKTEDKRFKIAIGICQTVDRLHKGHDDKNGIGYAHMDIKPQNITENYHLVDFGLSTKEVYQTHSPMTGTFLYMPAESHTKEHTGQQYDMLALKRTLFMPTSMYCLGNKSVYTQASEFCSRISVLDSTMLLKYNLDTYINTSDEKTYFREDDTITASTLAALLINAYLNLEFENEHLVNNISLSRAITTLYANGKTTASEILNNLTTKANLNLIAALGERDQFKQLEGYQKDSILLEYMEQATSITAACALLCMKETHKTENYATIVDEQSSLGKSLAVLEQWNMQHHYKQVLESPYLQNLIATNPNECDLIKTLVLENKKFSEDGIKDILEDKQLRQLVLFVYNKVKNTNGSALQKNRLLKELVEIFYNHPELDIQLLGNIIAITESNETSLWSLFKILASNGDKKGIKELTNILQFSVNSGQIKQSISYLEGIGLNPINYFKLLTKSHNEFIAVTAYLYREKFTQGIDENFLQNKSLLELLNYFLVTFQKKHVDATLICYQKLGYDEKDVQFYEWLKNDYHSIEIVNRLNELDWLDKLPSLVENKDLKGNFYANLKEYLSNTSDENRDNIHCLFKMVPLQNFLIKSFKPKHNTITACITLIKAGIDISNIDGLTENQIKGIEVVAKFNPENKVACYNKILQDSGDVWSHLLVQNLTNYQTTLLLKIVSWSIESDECMAFLKADDTLCPLLHFASTLEEARHYVTLSKLIAQLTLKQDKFNTNGLSDAALSVGQLINQLSASLKTISDSIKENNKPDMSKFNADCIKAIKEHRPGLESHRSLLSVLDTFLTVLASLIVFYPIVYGYQKYQGINYSFFKTDTCKLLDNVDASIEAIQLSSK